MNIDFRLGAAAALALIVAGCTPTDVTFGNAVRQTMAAQVVNPDPQYEDPIPTTEGAKAAKAVDRYRTDKVKQPDTIRTTDTETGGPK
ncbi:MAG: hypothetical protein JHC57_03415 [Sphingopyxis sp.]|uniref:hypothetical protein n=1 Tax=Sphingopyxis sp. TaxID=1908224 RepID=UPI001A294965|nr:hypothetical protein [Sphingopyxis sp.]MBJ7498786.1 hypothetical protein [Sphingopyxis sp.]